MEKYIQIFGFMDSYLPTVPMVPSTMVLKLLQKSL